MIATCDDSMYAGRMKRIGYDFVPGGGDGVLLREKAFDGTWVTTLAISGNNRTVARGDGPYRSLTYSGGFLVSQTDFRPAPDTATSSQHFLNGYVDYSTDPRTNRTDYTHNSVTGKLTSLTFPLTPSDDSGTRGTIVYGYDPANPFYQVSVQNERNYATTYTRDATTHEVTGISYPDNATEAFVYNSFGQVTRHTRKNGFYEYFDYDARGLLTTAWNPTDSATVPSSGPHTSISYYPVTELWADRVHTITDPNGHVTTYEYERDADGNAIRGRGLVSKIIDPYEKYRSFIYDRVGRVLHQENELRQPMEYVYDEYGRVTQAKVPRPDPSNPATQLPGQWDITTYDYTPASGTSPLSLTANAPTAVTTQMNVKRTIAYDGNLRALSGTQVDTSNGSNYASTSFHYDPAGNRDSVTDGNSKVTTFEYDQRNRRTKATSPLVDVDGVSGQVALVTQWFYDPVGNSRLTILPDTNQQSATYDELNRVLSSTDPMNRTTNYTYHPSGAIHTVEDPNHQVTQFLYDERDLKTLTTYPGGADYINGWVYDNNGNMLTRPTITRVINGSPVVGPKQIFTYDVRNRLQTMRWDNAIDFSNFTYDDAGRLFTALNPNASITRQYDVAGRLILDQQVLPAVENPTTGPPVAPLSVVSRRTHGSAGTFDIPLPLSGNPGIECRTGGNYTIVLTFRDPVTVGNVTVSSGTGVVSNPHPAGGTVITINLTGVSNAQRLTLTLSNLSNQLGTGDLIVPMIVLAGDVNASGNVSSSDVAQVQSQASYPVTQSNFRNDVNGSGGINSTDIATVQAAVSGATLPGALPASQTAQVKYVYDGDGRPSRLYVNGIDYDFSYAYDPIGRLQTVSHNIYPASYHYGYDLNSNVVSRTDVQRNTALVYVPDALNRVRELTMQAQRYPNGTNGAPVPYAFSHEHYAYDRMSRVAGTSRDEDGGLSDRFTYNPAGELTQVNYQSQNNRYEVFGLDSGGNRTSVNANGMLRGWSPNQLNEYTTAGADLVTNGSEHEITAIQKPSETVNYTHLGDGPLASASSSSQGVYTVGYDALGRCVRRTTNGQMTYYAFSGTHAILDLNPAQSGQGGVVGNTLFGLGVDEIIARNNGGTGQYFLQDRLGSVRAVVDALGQVTESYRYDAFGAPRFFGPASVGGIEGPPLTTSMQNNRFLFTGREWVQRYGFYEYRARAYNPALGRFMSEDPSGFDAGDTNLFRYCGGDPVNATDPTGLATYIGFKLGLA